MNSIVYNKNLTKKRKQVSLKIPHIRTIIKEREKQNY